MDPTALQITLDAYALDDVPSPYWLSGDDTCRTFCRECAEKALAAGDGEELDGGWCGETDHCLHCETCGRLLEYTLTDYGASSEIDHYRTVRFRKPLSREEAYHVARVIGATHAADAVKLAARAVKAIPATAPVA